MKQFLPIIFAAGLAGVVTGCQTAGSGTAADKADAAPPQTEAVSTFGTAFEADRVIPANQLLAKYSATELADTVATTLRGTVNEVCQAKGCWMTIAASEEGEVMVKFKDYGFFMPKDISGREVVMHGKAYYQVTPVDELRHYAEDAGKSAEEIAKITEARKELRFLADGVQLIKKGDI